MSVWLSHPRTLVGAVLLLLTAAGYWAGSATATPTCDDTCEKNACVIWKGSESYPYPKLDYHYASSSSCGILFYAEQDYHYYVISGPSLGSVRNYEGSFEEFRECDDLSTLDYWKFTGATCAIGGYTVVAALCYTCSTVPES
jgi:hypothetical protein